MRSRKTVRKTNEITRDARVISAPRNACLSDVERVEPIHRPGGCEILHSRASAWTRGDAAPAGAPLGPARGRGRRAFSEGRGAPASRARTSEPTMHLFAPLVLAGTTLKN